MEHFLNKLKDIRAFIFDVDGVLTDGTVYMTNDGRQTRAFNIKDGYALQLAAKKGYAVCAISGSRSEAARHRLNGLGIKDVYLSSHNKIEALNRFLSEKEINPANVVYMGDDITDLPAMKLTGLPVAPADAAEEVKEISVYVSPLAGGKGCVRDIIEKVMKVQEKWGV